MRTIGVLIVVCLFPRISSSAEVERLPVSAARLPFAFVENRGQVDGRVRFYARCGGQTCYLTDDSMVLQIRRAHSVAGTSGAHVSLTFESASHDACVEGREELPGRLNYFRGKDPARWRAGVPAFARVRYHDLYPGVDVEFREEQGHLEYDLVLAPGADPESIVLQCEGADAVYVEEHGALVIETPAGRIEQPEPPTYQISSSGVHERIECSYRLLGSRRIGFYLPHRAAESAVVIDPGLVYATYLGGSEDDAIGGVAFDHTGAALVCGTTESADFPTTPGAFDTSYNSTSEPGDVFVAKLTADGSNLVFATFLGGSYNEFGAAIGVDGANDVLVTGETRSEDFPTTAGAYDTTYDGPVGPFARGDDAFVAKLSPDGSLVYSTFLGGGQGTGGDHGLAIAVEISGAAFITGATTSSDFPTTPGAYDTAHHGTYQADAFVTKVSPDGSSLVYSTYVGGADEDSGVGIALADSGEVVVAGTTTSQDFPTTAGAYDTTHSGPSINRDAFVMRLSAGGDHLVYSTLLGRNGDDDVFGVAVDPLGAALITGTTGSSDFPTTPRAYQTTFTSGANVAFVSKLDPSGSTLEYSTFLAGGPHSSQGRAITVDRSGSAIVAGGCLAGFPVTADAYDTSSNGSYADGFVAKLSPDGQSLQYSTYLGGAGDDWMVAIAWRQPAAVLVGGFTFSSDFPTTTGAYDTSFNGGYRDAIVAKLDLSAVNRTAPEMRCVAPSSRLDYGFGKAGTGGTPLLYTDVNPVLCSTITMSVTNSLGAPTVGVLLIGVIQANVKTQYGGHLWLLPETAILLHLPAHGIDLPGTIPCEESLCGMAMFLQVLEVDPGASKGVSFSKGLELLLGRGPR